MGREIERKFLPAGDAWRTLAEGRGLKLVQGYLAAERGRSVRVRITRERAGEQAFLTVKGAAGGSEGISRLEFEYPVPVVDAEAMLALCPLPLIEKIRYRLPLDGFIWEVDEFFGDNAGLVVIEVELQSEDQPFKKPAWVGEEVSRDPRYTNAMLARNPYRSWDKR